MDKKELTHLDENGKAHMVDISQKLPTLRIAIAKGEIVISPATLKLVVEGAHEKR